MDKSTIKCAVMDKDTIKCVVALGLMGNPGVKSIRDSADGIDVTTTDGREFAVTIREKAAKGGSTPQGGK